MTPGTEIRSGTASGFRSDEELEDLLADLGTALVVREESLRGNGLRSVREAVCAFSNDLPDHRLPGVVFVGADDAGRPTGLPITDELLRQLSEVGTDGDIVPTPRMSVEKRVLCGKPVAVVSVSPSDLPPVRYRGRICIRVGPRRAYAGGSDERILTEKRRHRDRHFDSLPVEGARLSDLLLLTFEHEYLPRAVTADTLEKNDRTIEERLAALKFIASIHEPTPTIAGLLTLGRNPQDFLPGAYIQFLRVEGAEWGGPITDEVRCMGPLALLLQHLDSQLSGHNRVAVDLTSGFREKRVATYPLGALQQLTRNAVMHRTYQDTNSPVQVYWFDDRVEINSPGGAYGEVTPESFGVPGVVDYRNPVLAEMMRVQDLVQRFGFGIQLARRELAENGNPPPEFRVEPNRVFCTVRRRPDDPGGSR